MTHPSRRWKKGWPQSAMERRCEPRLKRRKLGGRSGSTGMGSGGRIGTKTPTT